MAQGGRLPSNVDSGTVTNPGRARRTDRRAAPRLAVGACLRAWLRAGVTAVVALIAVGACDAGPVPATPPITPGTGAVPRQVNVILSEYAFGPAVVDLVPGETIHLNVVNEGLEIHELVLGPQAVQDAWAAAERSVANPPPGATPFVAVPASLQGVRLVVGSGQTVSITYTVAAGGRRCCSAAASRTTTSGGCPASCGWWARAGCRSPPRRPAVDGVAASVACHRRRPAPLRAGAAAGRSPFPDRRARVHGGPSRVGERATLATRGDPCPPAGGPACRRLT